MENFRIPRALCAAIDAVIGGSHSSKVALFRAAGAKGEPPGLSHAENYKLWLFAEGNNPETDSLKLIGNLIEEFMDVDPSDQDSDANHGDYIAKKEHLIRQLELAGLRYYRGGRVFPIGIRLSGSEQLQYGDVSDRTQRPKGIDDLLEFLIRKLPRAVFPLSHRRKGLHALSFDSEYDIQDLLHSQLRPWINDIRSEEVTPSYAGRSTRIDFLLAAHRIAIEVKRVRELSHAKQLSQELIIDFEHYANHHSCDNLWCVVYDPNHFLQNPAGFSRDLEGERTFPSGKVNVKILVI